MRTYIGWYLEAKTYTNREQVPRSEDPDTLEGAVQIRYDNISKSKVKTSVVEMETITQVIEVETRVDLKPDDRVLTEHGWLKVVQTELIVPEDKLSIVRMWPNRRGFVEVKRVYLG
jgi:hypothetical protein